MLNCFIFTFDDRLITQWLKALVLEAKQTSYLGFIQH